MSFSTWIRTFKSKRKLYPSSLLDRVIFWIGLVTLISFMINAWVLGTFDRFPDWIEAMGWALPIGFLLGSYLFQDPPKNKVTEEEYTLVIADIEKIGGQLNKLEKFLKQGRQKVLESEATLRKLQNEKTELEPVISTQRETVEAILAAYGRTMASRAWKERIFGFMSGLLASFLAAMVFESFRR